MTRTKKRALVAAAMSLGLAAVAALVGPGVAYAQSGSRICGVKWEAGGTPVTAADPTMAIWKIYEVPKILDVPINVGIAGSICDVAAKMGGGSRAVPSEAPRFVREKLHLFGITIHLPTHEFVESDRFNSAFNREEISMHECESLTKEIAESGSPQFELGGDICNLMKKSDEITKLEAYWLVRAKGDWYFGQ